jgi:putative oxidoreductase
MSSLFSLPVMRRETRWRRRRQQMIGISPLPLRIALGLIMINHGQQKVFGASKEQFPEVVASLGVPEPRLVAKGVSALEFFGGLALMAGLGTRPVALFFTGEFLYITFRVKFSQGFSAFEYDLALLGGFLSLALTGGGAGSLDRVIFGD